jgi:hypothetical protein
MQVWGNLILLPVYDFFVLKQNVKIEWKLGGNILFYVNLVFQK